MYYDKSKCHTLYILSFRIQLQNMTEPRTFQITNKVSPSMKFPQNLLGISIMNLVLLYKNVTTHNFRF